MLCLLLLPGLLLRLLRRWLLLLLLLLLLLMMISLLQVQLSLLPGRLLRQGALLERRLSLKVGREAAGVWVASRQPPLLCSNLSRQLDRRQPGLRRGRLSQRSRQLAPRLIQGRP